MQEEITLFNSTQKHSGFLNMNGYLRPGESLVSVFQSYIYLIWLDADSEFVGKTYALILAKPHEWYEKMPGVRSSTLTGKENRIRTKQLRNNKDPNQETIDP